MGMWSKVSPCWLGISQCSVCPCEQLCHQTPVQGPREPGQHEYSPLLALLFHALWLSFMPSDSHSCCSLLIFPSANAYCRETQPGWPPQVVSPVSLPQPAGEEPFWVYGAYHALSQSSLHFLALHACRTELHGSFPHDPPLGAVTLLGPT